MSLINDALKKAQKQRTGEAPSLASMPSVGGQSAASISRSGKPGSGNPLLVPAGIGAGVLLVLVVGGYFALRGKPETENLKPEVAKNTATQTPTPPAPLPAVAQQTAGQTPGSQQGTTVPAPVFTLPVAPKPEPVVAKTEPAPAPQVSGLKSQVSVPSPTAAPASPAAKPESPHALDPVAIEYLDNIKVAGIRASATDSKVLMNDRVYRIGSVVNGEMGLKLVGITANSLTFEDQQGGRYTRTF